MFAAPYESSRDLLSEDMLIHTSLERTLNRMMPRMICLQQLKNKNLEIIFQFVCPPFLWF